MSGSPLLHGQVALVTGGSRGIGLAVARYLAAAGARLMLVARSPRELAAVDIEPVAVFAGDVSDPAVAEAAVQATVDRYGSLHLLVNAAGINGTIGRAVDADWQAWRHALDVNLLAPFLMMQRAVPAMRRAGGGKIINFAGGGDGPLARFSAYSAAKAGLIRLTETLAEELAEDGIAVNIVAPGPVNTRFLEEGLAAGEERVGRERYRILQRQKEEGGVSADLAAGLCVWLASSASDGLTGKYLSAVWDDWRNWGAAEVAELAATPDRLVLRRCK